HTHPWQRYPHTHTPTHTPTDIHTPLAKLPPTDTHTHTHTHTHTPMAKVPPTDIHNHSHMQSNAIIYEPACVTTELRDVYSFQVAIKRVPESRLLRTSVCGDFSNLN